MVSEHFLSLSRDNGVITSGTEGSLVEGSQSAYRIAVVGSACRLPNAGCPEDLWNLVKAGRDGISRATDERYRIMRLSPERIEEARRLGLDLGGFVDDIDAFDPTLFGISFAEAATLDPQQRMLLELSWSALENAGISPQSLAGSRTGVFLGIASYDYSLQQAGFDPYGKRITPYTALGNAHSIAANRISYAFDLKGPSMAIDTACSSSSYALHHALRSLSTRECDATLVAGVQLILSMNVTRAFSMAQLLARDGRCKVYDANADGYVRAEGCVVLVLKRLEDAVAAGDRVLGVILGSAVNQDGKTEGITAPNGDMQSSAINAALASAGLTQHAISYVEGNGTGTKRGDTIELKALASVFKGSRESPVYLGSVTANLGHLEPVRGLAGLLKTLLAFEHEEIPAQANLAAPNEAAVADGARIVLARETVPWPRGAVPRRAGVSCFGFGGANSHIIVEEPPCAAPAQASKVERPTHVLKLSTKRPEQIADAARRLVCLLADKPELALADICHTANIGRADFAERAAIIARTRDDLAQALETLARDEPEPDAARGVSRKAKRRAAFLFNGAAVCRGTGRALFLSSPPFASTLREADVVLRRLTGASLIELLYGEGSESGTALTAHPLSDAALLSLNVALARLWMAWGIEPLLITGDRMGKIAACVLDGILALEDALRIAARPLARPQAAPGEPSGRLAAAGNPSSMHHQAERHEPFASPGHCSTRFRDSLESILEAGVDTIVEIGSDAVVLTGMTEALSARSVTAVTSLARSRGDWSALAGSVAALYCAGTSVDWRGWDAPYTHKRVQLPNYPFTRERFWHNSGYDAGNGTLPTQSTPVRAAPDGARSFASTPVSETGVPRRVLVESDPATVLAVLRRHLSEVTSIPADRLAEHTEFREIGFDSIIGLELMLRIETSFGVLPSSEELGEDSTLGELVEILIRTMNAAQLAGMNGASGNPAAALGEAKASARRVSAPGPEAAILPPDKSRGGLLVASLRTEDYCETIRPDFTRALRGFALDLDCHWARGDRIRGRVNGVEIEAIDMLGGYGAMLFGHNHPALVAILQEALSASRPQFVQATNRTAAGTLARELARRVGALTGDGYVAVLGSTGAEMVEAAVKHVLGEWAARRRCWLGAHGGSEAPGLDLPPVMIAVEGSYHGKTLGAYALTWNAPGRAEIGIKPPFEVVWIERNNVDAARAAFASALVSPYRGVDIAPWSRVGGVLVEPVQGEGGIFPLSRDYLAAIREAADAAGVPVIVDEIQSGLGRCGSFLASSPAGLRGDYYLFGKALGGGLTKSAALLISDKRYLPGFGFAHTSTYGEDDHTALVGLGALKLLEQDDLSSRAAASGSYLLERLASLKARYPSVIADVRGLGLMVGLELTDQAQNPSPLIRGLVEQRLLSVVVVGQLLHSYGVRIGTTLSRPSTLRLEPSAYISRKDIDHVADSLGAVCQTIVAGDAATLCRHLAQVERTLGRGQYQVQHMPKSAPPIVSEAGGRVVGKAVFLGHLVHADDIGQWDPSLLSLEPAERERLAQRISHPIQVMSMPIRAETGDTVELDVQILALSSSVIEQAFRSGERGRIVAMVGDAIDHFATRGARVIGLGGLLSVVTANGNDVARRSGPLIVTTGNTYTVALAAEAIIKGTWACGLDPARARLGVVGAGGNIGSTLVRLLADRFERFTLVGRKASRARVVRVAELIYKDAWERWLALGAAAGGLARLLGDMNLFAGFENELESVGGIDAIGTRLRRRIETRFQIDPFISIAEDLDAIANCQVVVTASNSAAPILGPRNVGAGVRLICDISVPSDVDPALLIGRPDLKVIRGGIARAPGEGRFRIENAGLPEGHLLACMAETAILGLAGECGFPTTGEITPAGVRVAIRLAERYGFCLGHEASEKVVSMNGADRSVAATPQR